MPSIMERKELSEALSKDRASLIFCTKLVGGVILKKQNRKTEEASENRKRGRPPIDIGITSYLDGTRRTKVNAKYMYEAISLISEAASEIPDSLILWHSDDATQTATGKHGILEQIGRMWLQDQMSYDSCVFIANLSISALKAGCTSREIEYAIRKIRNAARLVEKNPDNDWFYQSEVKAVLDLQEMAGD